MRASLYTREVYDTCLRRIDAVTEETGAQWGSMSAAQMLSHCAEVQEVGNGKDLVGTPLIVRLFAKMIRNLVVGDKPYPRSTRTHPQYLQDDERNFELEKLRLIAALDSFVDAGPREGRHSLFGPMSAEERSWTCYKHLDHHLTQFGV